MMDVTADFATLQSSESSIDAAWQMVSGAGDLGYISESIIGSGGVASALQDVATEHSVRAEVASQALQRAAQRTKAAAREFSGLDRALGY